MAKRTGLLRMAGAGCARALVHARRRAQAAGDFPQSRGSWLRHEKLIDFIGRNYESDDEGRWFFQNGPQQVYVELGAPVDLAGFAGLPPAVPYRFANQCGECLLDEEGRLYIASPQGLGLVHSQDMVLAAEAVEQGVWVPRDVVSADLPVQYGFVRSPASHSDVKFQQLRAEI